MFYDEEEKKILQDKAVDIVVALFNMQEDLKADLTVELCEDPFTKEFVTGYVDFHKDARIPVRGWLRQENLNINLIKTDKELEDTSAKTVSIYGNQYGLQFTELLIKNWRSLKREVRRAKRIAKSERKKIKNFKVKG